MSAMGRLVADRMLRQTAADVLHEPPAAPQGVARVEVAPSYVDVIRGPQIGSEGAEVWRCQWRQGSADYLTEAHAEEAAPGMAKVYGMVVVFPVVVQP